MDDRQEQFEQLSAYLDGELKADQALRLEQALADDAELAAELDSLRKTRQLLRSLPAEPAPESFAHNVLTHWRRTHRVGREGLGGPLRASRWISFAAAAIVLFAAGAGMYVVLNLSHEPPITELATGPGTPIIVTDLPAEDIFTSDLDAARDDVAEVLARNGISMNGRFLAAAGPAGSAEEGSDELPPGAFQAVQVGVDTVEIEVLASPAVAQQILSELEIVQRRQAPPADELIAGIDSHYSVADDQPASSPEIASVRDEATEHIYGQDGEPMMTESAETAQQPDDGAAEPPEDQPRSEATDAIATAGQAAETDDDDVESASESRYRGSMTLAEAAPLADHDDGSGLQAAPDQPADQGWDQQGRADSDAGPDWDRPARPWFGGEALTEAGRDRQGAATNGPLASENEQGVTAERSASSADGAAWSTERSSPITRGVAPPQAAEVEGQPDSYSGEAFEDAGEEHREPPPAAEPPVRLADRSVDTSQTQPGDETAPGKLVHLQRLVIVLRRISAADLPVRASQRAGELRETRLRAAAGRTSE